MRAVNPSQALARTLIDEFVRHGVRHVCLAPGSRSAPLALAAAEHEGVQPHVALDERSASFFALGTARATGVPALAMCTSGTATANFHPAIAEAANDRVPLIVLTADRPEELRATGANQTIDQTLLFGSATRFYMEVTADPARPDYWRSAASRALAEAVGSPAGPVHVNVLLRDPLVPDPVEGFDLDLGGRSGGRPWTSVTSGPPRPRPDDVERLAGLIERTERGVVLAGACRIDPEPVLSLARGARWPVLAEPASGLRCDDLAVSTYEALLRAPSFAQTHRPDAVLLIGRTGLSRALARWLTPDIPQILVDADAQWLDPQRALSEIVRADPGPLCAELNRVIEARPHSQWMEEWSAAEKRARIAVDALLDGDDRPSEPRTARDLAALLPDGSSLVVGSSMPVRDLDSFMAPRRGLRVLGNRGANGIDGFVSTALGVAAASDRPTYALCGDLTMLHDQNGFLSVQDIDCTFVVLNNDGGGIFSFLEQATHPDFERLFGTPQGIDLARFADLYDLGYRGLERAADLGPSLAEARAAGGVHLIEIRTTRPDNVGLHHQLWTAVSDAVSR